MVWTGCLPDPAYPDEPEISFVSIELQSNGSRELVIQFSDGDGDLGAEQKKRECALRAREEEGKREVEVVW